MGSMDSTDSADSNPNRFEIRVNDTALASRKRVDDEGEVTRGKRPKRTKTTVHVPVPSSSSSQKFAWTPDEELLILEGIVYYERETDLSYRSDWDAFNEHSKGFVPKEFTKKQLSHKVDHLHRRFTKNLAKAQPSFANTHDAHLFKLSMDIWGHDEKATDLTSDEQQITDLNHVEHENIVETQVDDTEKEKKKKKKKRKVNNAEQEKEEGEKVAVEEIGHLQDALEATLLFQTSGQPQQKWLLENLKNVEAREGKELIEEGKALAAEEMEILTKIQIKKLAYSLKFANAIPSA